jgi:hypothetical protein
MLRITCWPPAAAPPGCQLPAYGRQQAPDGPSTPQSIDWLLALVHRRCRDDKAAVRKSALQLLEHIVVMRCNWSCMQPLAPSQQDLDTLEAATTDSLVGGRASWAGRVGGPAGAVESRAAARHPGLASA